MEMKGYPFIIPGVEGQIQNTVVPEGLQQNSKNQFKYLASANRLCDASSCISKTVCVYFSALQNTLTL